MLKLTATALRAARAPLTPLARGLATPTATPLSSQDVLHALKARRSIYALEPKSTVSDDHLAAIVRVAVTHVPTAFNMQSSRAALVLGDKNKQLWNALWDSNSQTIPEQFRDEARKKWDAAYFPSHGSVVFFEDRAVVDDWVKRMPALDKLFPEWSANGTGMLQMTVWTALSNEGMGASLQHFPQMHASNAEALRTVLGTPESWEATAVMPFGGIAAPAGDKAFHAIDERVKVFA